VFITVILLLIIITTLRTLAGAPPMKPAKEYFVTRGLQEVPVVWKLFFFFP
jgi:hypothetical protein